MSDLVDIRGLTRARGLEINPPINPPRVDQPPSKKMTGAQYAKHLGVSPAAVSKAIKSGVLGPAIRWKRRGTQRVATIVKIPLADMLWLCRPGAKAPALEVAPAAGNSGPTPSTPTLTSAPRR